MQGDDCEAEEARLCENTPGIAPYEETNCPNGQESQAIANLPDLSPTNTSATQKATGTDGKNSADYSAFLGGKQCTAMDGNGQTTLTGNVENAVLKANGRIRTDNPWFTKPELYH